MSDYKNCSIYLDHGKFSAFYSTAQWKVTLLAQDVQLAPGNSQRARSTFHWLGIILGYFDPQLFESKNDTYKLFISSIKKLSNTRNSGNT